MKIESMSAEEANAPLPEMADLSGIPDDQLDSALSQYSDSAEAVDLGATTVGDGDEITVEDDPVAEETPVAEEPKDDEPEPVAATEETPAEEPEEKPVEEPEFSELDEVKAMIELSDLKSQKAETEKDRWRLLADKNAGKVAHLEQLIKAREQRGVAEPGDDFSREPLYDEPGATDRAAAVSPELQSELNEIRNERVTRALQTEGAQFRDRHREFLQTIGKQDEEAQKAFAQDFNAALSEKAEEFADAFTGTDVKIAQVSARTAYDSAIVEAQIRMKERMIDASRKRREERQAALIEEKRASSPTQGQAPQPAETPTDKPLHELSDKELNALSRSIRY